jgi:bacillopeptidase F (M6 metalloprotease family)
MTDTENTQSAGEATESLSAASETDTGHQVPDGGSEADDEHAGGHDEATGDDSTDNGNAEAAKWRHRLRDAEAERDGLQARIDTAETAVVDYALNQAGLDVRLWRASEVVLDQLRDDSGQLDIAAVVGHAQQLKSELGLSGPRPNSQQGQPSQPPRTGLADAFDPRNLGRLR